MGSTGSKLLQHHKLIFFIILAVGGGTIFKAMYLREVFYNPWNDFFGLNNTDSGLLMSWLGLVGIFSGAVAGIIVDKFKSPKFLLCFAYFAMGALAWWQSFRPSYGMMFIIVGLMSFVANGLFLVSLTKIARLIASDNEQARYFGMLESGRGIAGTLLTLIAVGIVSAYSNDELSIGFILRMDGVVYIVLGIISWKLFPDGVSSIENAQPKTVRELLTIVKCGRLWLAALTVACTIFIYQTAAYFVPYLNDIYGMDADSAAIVGMVRAYFLAFVVAPFAGLLADKFGSTIRMMGIFLALGAITALSILIVPHTSFFLPILICQVLLIGSLTFGLRGIMYAQVSELRIPKEYTGTAMGFLLFVGFSPEAFVHIIFGHLLDVMHNDAYPLIFISMAIVMALGCGICIVLRSIAHKVQAAEKKE